MRQVPSANAAGPASALSSGSIQTDSRNWLLPI
jgi:hypothetical protein